MPIDTKFKILGSNYNTVQLRDGSVAKHFLLKDRMLVEIEFLEKFKNYFNAPEIKRIDYETNTLFFEYIEGTPLSVKSALDILSANELYKFVERVPFEKGKTRDGILVNLFPPNVIDGYLTHGDFRTANIIMSEKGKLYLIDFENGNYLFREFDKAYLFLSLYWEDKSKAMEFLDIVRSNNQYNEKFLYAELYFINAILLNPKIEQQTKFKWIKFEGELLKELTNIKEQHSENNNSPDYRKKSL
jgi:hypothetical protein